MSLLVCECGNEIPFGYRGGQQQRCAACRQERRKSYNRNMMRRKAAARACLKCGGVMPVTNGRRRELCGDCIKTMILLYNSTDCLYCGQPAFGKRYCSRKCSVKIIYYANEAKR